MTQPPSKRLLTEASAALGYAPLKSGTRALRIAAAVQGFDMARAMRPVMNQQMLPLLSDSTSHGITSAVSTAVTTTGPFPIVGGAITGSFTGGAGYVGPGAAGNENTPILIAFETDAPVFAFGYLGSASPSYRLIVDGEAMTPTYAAAIGGGGNQRWLKVTFGTRKWRRIVLDSGSFAINQLVVGPTDTLYPGTFHPTVVGFMGDSYCVNNGGEITHTAARILGVTAYVNAEGGTGYNQNQAGTGGKQVFSGRLPTVTAANPDALVIYGGINDGTTTLQADCLALIQAARASIADLPIVIVGSQAPPSAVSSAATKSALLKNAAAAGRAAYVDPVTGNVYAASGTQLVAGTPWIVGTGYQGATTGSGNADLQIGSDGIHPYVGSAANGYTDSGYLYHGIRLAEALRVALTAAI